MHAQCRFLEERKKSIYRAEVGKASGLKANPNTNTSSTPQSVHQGIFLLKSTSSADSLGVFLQPPCAITCIKICAHIKTSQALAAIPLSGHTKVLNTLGGMGSAALAAAVALPR